MRQADDCGPRAVDPAGPPWRRHGRHANWPPGAAVAASLFHLVGTGELADRGGVHLATGPLYYFLLLAGPVALLWRRRAPLAAFAVSAAASIAFASHAEPYWMYAVAPAIALFTLAKQGRRTAAAIAASAAWTGYLLVTVVLAGPLDLPAGVSPGLRELTLAAAGLGGAVLAGMVSQVHRDQMATIARARRERARAEEEQERRQASEERLRIARELHDVLGHHLSLINVQAGVGLHLMDNRPEQAREALSAIKTASAEALREVRSVLGVLRTEDEEAPRQPALGLSRLSDLTAGAGFPVRTRVDGEERELPAEVDRAAYRIVQEALTNVRRHAGPEPTALVEIRYTPGSLMLSITNTGRAAADPADGAGSRGSGIAGMQARADSLGGTFTARPSSGGGFLVTAVLPTEPARTPVAEPALSENGPGVER
ncbi:two-component sensor histidine kinase [Actinoplanes lobatus]|uniref:histidine kinase n=1 Tax=Actinoplanes lobatus TaxID=113568 RepID=A0A7W7MGV1_9ACTN|nr:histidine kinase [Actinoplanes lobatus]MBB4749656.1 signal transduction histidine kinase [Actinoplanes lobatus]GGN75615.1 two-component sensor histidine kinase [Actinoplanes lobatus]GIE38395.1 two-component sensor histidine kinase [Actinoplanes lobatus]